MKFFITKSNFLHITRKVELTEEDLKNGIYKKSIYFLNDIEKRNIISVKQFLEHAQDDLYQFTGTGFYPDSYSYIFEQDRYAKYHLSETCHALHNTYKDLSIPVEIQYKNGCAEKDIARIEAFRAWFKQTEIQRLFKNSPKKFLERMQLKFNLVNIPVDVEFQSMGVQDITNLSETEIENRIDALILEASALYKSCPRAKEILVKNGFSKKTYLVSSKKYMQQDLKNNCTGFTDEEVKDEMKSFYSKIKKPIMDLLMAYWITKLNPELNFSTNILEQLKFKPCKFCLEEAGDL